MQRQLKTTDEHPSNALVQYRKVNAIFGNSPMDGTTTKEKTIFINEARRDNYQAIVTGPPTSPGRLVSFSEEDVHSVHFPHKDALVVTIHVGGCKVSKILVNRGNSVNILYGHALDRMENTPAQD